jgi:integrase
MQRGYCLVIAQQSPKRKETIMAMAVDVPQQKPNAIPEARRRASARARRIPADEKGSLQIRAYKGKAFYEARWRDMDRADRRKRLGRAWAKQDADGHWVPRRGRVAGDLLDERRAYPKMIAAIEEHEQKLLLATTVAPLDHVLFDDVVPDYLVNLETEKRVKPSTLRNTRTLLAKPSGRPGQRGARIMRLFGGRELFGILTKDIRTFLAQLDREEISPRTVNIHRSLLHAVFEYARREETFGLPENPVTATTKRLEDGSTFVDTFEPEELLTVARTAREGRHRGRGGYFHSKFSEATEKEWRRMNKQDASLFIIAFTTGLRLGELLALRWRDVDLRGGVLSVGRAMSDGKETSTKSRRSRAVPLSEQAIAEFRRLRRRHHFCDRADHVFCRPDGGPLDRHAVRKRFVRSQELAGVAVRRFHDLRHSFGTLAVRMFDVVAVKEMMGHARLSTTERYLHGKPKPNDGAKLTLLFGGGESDPMPLAA